MNVARYCSWYMWNHSGGCSSCRWSTKRSTFAFASGYGEAGISEDHKGSAVLQKPFREADLRRVLEGLVAQTA